MIDLLRGIAIIEGALLFMLMTRVFPKPGDPARMRGLFITIGLLALPLWLTEAQQLGQPFVWWRLPLCFIAFTSGIVNIWHIDRHER